ncbi:MAG TPA: AraC family transcriptional regulator [Blastocatellia bacterium]|nr:AraC family transcriptional regulator [Blastocatellia bacterium]
MSLGSVRERVKPAREGATPAVDTHAATRRIIARPQFTIRHVAANGIEFQPHSHSTFTVTLVLDGEMSTTIGADDYRVRAGETALTSVNQVHEASAQSVEFVSVGVSPLLVNELVAEIGFTRTAGEIVFRAAVVTDDVIARNARAMAGELADGELGHSAMLESMVRQLVIHLLRTHLTVRKSDKIELSRAGPVDRRLRRALEFIHDNYSHGLSLEDVASAAYLSEYHFARLFKEIIGVTPHVYLANLRLERARKLLTETELAISEVASMVGYHSQSHFTKVFKSITGVTPRAYRESSR